MLTEIEMQWPNLVWPFNVTHSITPPRSKCQSRASNTCLSVRPRPPGIMHGTITAECSRRLRSAWVTVATPNCPFWSVPSLVCLGSSRRCRYASQQNSIVNGGYGTPVDWLNTRANTSYGRIAPRGVCFTVRYGNAKWSHRCRRNTAHAGVTVGYESGARMAS